MPDVNKIAYIFPGQGSQKVGMGRDCLTGSNRLKLFSKKPIGCWVSLFPNCVLKALKKSYVRLLMLNRLWLP